MKKGTKGCISKNILHRLFNGEKLEALLNSSTPEDPELEIEEDASSESGAQDDGEIESESDSEPGLEAIGPQPSRKEMTAYKAFLRCEINQRHTCDPDLRCRDASQVIGNDRIHASFQCPVCRQDFDAGFLVYKFYQHVEQPSHWQYVKDSGFHANWDVAAYF